MIRRRRRPEPRPWRYNWRNPDMHVCTRVLVQDFEHGPVRKEAVEYGPEEMQALAREGMKDTAAPKYRQDPSYHWAEKVREKRRENN